MSSIQMPGKEFHERICSKWVLTPAYHLQFIQRNLNRPDIELIDPNFFSFCYHQNCIQANGAHQYAQYGLHCEVSEFEIR